MPRCWAIVRRDHRLGRLDRTAATQAVAGLRDWPGVRFGHRLLLDRSWELRDRVRSWDALYVALAEALHATLVTLDGRLARVQGLDCEVEVVDHRRVSRHRVDSAARWWVTVGSQGSPSVPCAATFQCHETSRPLPGAHGRAIATLVPRSPVGSETGHGWVPRDGAAGLSGDGCGGVFLDRSTGTGKPRRIPQAPHPPNRPLARRATPGTPRRSRRGSAPSPTDRFSSVAHVDPVRRPANDG